MIKTIPFFVHFFFKWQQTRIRFKSNLGLFNFQIKEECYLSPINGSIYKEEIYKEIYKEEKEKNYWWKCPSIESLNKHDVILMYALIFYFSKNIL